jgi:hypothetical protein
MQVGPPQWRPLIFYAIFMLTTLWLWQEVAQQAAVRAIPYSEFKDDLRDGEVVECSVGQTEILGKIEPLSSAATQKEESKSKTAEPVTQPAPGSASTSIHTSSGQSSSQPESK